MSAVFQTNKQRQIQSIPRKSFFSDTSSATNQGWINLGTTSGLCDEKPETNHLSIIIVYMLSVQQNVSPKSNSEMNCIREFIKTADVT
jgi:hypothetical protein